MMHYIIYTDKDVIQKSGIIKGNVVSLVDNYFKKEEIIENIYVYDNGLIKGFIQMNGTEICKLYVDTSFQSEGIGNELIEFAIKDLHANNLWVLEKNVRAISFYQRHGFHLTGQKKFEEDTIEYLVKLRQKDRRER